MALVFHKAPIDTSNQMCSGLCDRSMNIQIALLELSK